MTPSIANPPAITIPAQMSANKFVAGPISGGAGVVTYRTIQDLDLETAPSAILGNLLPSTPQTSKGPITGPKINGIFYVDGVTYITVAQAVAAAVTAGGGVVDARGNSSATSLGTIDVGNNGPGVTILLGPYNYTATQIVMRSGTKIYGMGRPAGRSTATVITAANSSGSLVVFNTNASTDQPAQGVVLEGVTLMGHGGANTNNGIVFDASASTTGLGGVWFSRFNDLAVENFNNHSIWFKGPIAAGTNGDNQWITFQNVAVFRPKGAAGNALRIEGTNNFLDFINCVFDSPFGFIDTTGSALNVFIGGSPSGTSASIPNIIKFYDCAIENAGTLVQIDGGSHITFDHCHHEEGNVAYLITYNVNGAAIYTTGVDIHSSSFNGNVGVNSGHGALVKLDSSASGKVANVQFYDNIYLTSSRQPDNWILNRTNGVGINDYNNSYSGAGAPGVMRNQVATPTTTLKTGTQGGNYTTNSTSFVAVDNSNLTYTVTVPFGWKLICSAAFQQQVDTSSAQVLSRIQDTTAVVTVAASSIDNTAGNPVGVALLGVINGDGASHTVRLEYKTVSGSDTTVVNTGSGWPTLLFQLLPSN